MTKNIGILIVIITTLILMSCNDEILNQNPDHIIPEKNVHESFEKLERVLTGSYNEISKKYYLGRVLYKRAAVKGTDFRFVKTKFTPRSYEQIEYKYQESAISNGSAQSLWVQSYKSIANLNIIIDHIDNTKGDNFKKQQVKAQAYALRAMVFFDLSRTFCYPWIKDGANSQGVPLKTNSKDLVIKRATLGQTYTQIISDFERALNIIEDKTLKLGSTKYITKIGIKALLARVYLYKQDWNNALKYAKEVIANKGESNLMKPDNYLFNDYTSESLFEINISGQNTLGSNGLGAQFDYRQGGQGDVIATQTFVDLLNTYKEDPRAKLLVKDKEGTKHAFVKYINRGGGSGLSIHNIPIIRLSEIFLIAAEASANLSQNKQSQYYLNTIIKNRTTDFKTHKAIETDEALKNRIYNERRRELALEGHGVYDYIRTGRDINRTGKDYEDTGVNLVKNLKISAFSPKTIYPIPAKQIQQGTKQTYGY